MEIPLFEEGAQLRFERMILYPYPDMKRIWTRAWLTAVQDQQPNVEIRVLNPDSTENASVFLMARSEQRIETTLHLREPVLGATYHVIAELTLGLSESPELLERREFDLVLEFRNPEANDPGFGFGVDWEALAREQDQDQD